MTLNIIAANRTITELTTDRDGLIAKCQGLETEIENLKKMSTDMVEASLKHEEIITQLNETHKKELETVKASYEEQIKNLTVQTEQASQTSAAKAADIVASVGIEPGTIKVKTTELVLSKQELLAKLQTLTGQEQTAFYNKYKDVIWSK